MSVFINGSNYKLGVHGKVFYQNHGNWVLSENQSDIFKRKIELAKSDILDDETKAATKPSNADKLDYLMGVLMIDERQAAELLGVSVARLKIDIDAGDEWYRLDARCEAAKAIESAGINTKTLLNTVGAAPKVNMTMVDFLGEKIVTKAALNKKIQSLINGQVASAKIIVRPQIDFAGELKEFQGVLFASNKEMARILNIGEQDYVDVIGGGSHNLTSSTIIKLRSRVGMIADAGLNKEQIRRKGVTSKSSPSIIDRLSDLDASNCKSESIAKAVDRAKAPRKSAHLKKLKELKRLKSMYLETVSALELDERMIKKIYKHSANEIEESFKSSMLHGMSIRIAGVYRVVGLMKKYRLHASDLYMIPNSRNARACAMNVIVNKNWFAEVERILKNLYKHGAKCKGAA